MVSKYKLILFTTDTLHHRYFIKELNLIENIEIIIFMIKDKNKKLNNFDILQNNFEKKQFFKNKEYHIKNKKFFCANINSKKTIKKIQTIRPDIGILFGTKKVNEHFIKLFDNKLINIHRGMMEKYRGLDSEFWASYHKKFSSIGTTIHMVNKELDKGKILLQKKLILKKNMKCYQLRYYTTKIATQGILKIVKNVLSNKKKLKKKQIHGKYFSSIPEEIKNKACKNFNQFCRNI